MKRYLGAHVSVAGGLANGISAAKELGINTIQIHPTPPQRWTSKAIAEDSILLMCEALQQSQVERIFAHAIYLINLAQPDKQKFHLGKLSLVHYLNFMEYLQNNAIKSNPDFESGGVVVHVGSAIHYPTKQEALDRAAYGINWILENAPGKSKLLLESSAGAGQVIGEKLEDLNWLREQTEQKERVGIALDTEHMFASGYNWINTEEVITEIENLIPLDLVKVMHLNDSKVECGSKKDRHENLGEGLIGEDALKRIVTHPKLTHIPMVLETPRMKNIEEAQIDVNKLLQWAT